MRNTAIEVGNLLKVIRIGPNWYETPVRLSSPSGSQWQVDDFFIEILIVRTQRLE